MLIDSHCHLNFLELSKNINLYLDAMTSHKVEYALCVGTRPDNLNSVIEIANLHTNIFASVGVHPDERLDDFTLTHDYLIDLSIHPKVVAIGETGLDYFKVQDKDMSWQHKRFILHIEVSNKTKLPLIIHTRNSINDTLCLIKEHKQTNIGVVMHCFTENLVNAKKCLDLGCYISISGIVTFKNADIVKEVAKYVPLDMLLIETDAPFLAPVPFRGKLNHPALVKYTAEYVAELRGIKLEELAYATSNNFLKLFNKAKRI